MATVNNRINGNKFICNLLLFVLSILFPLFVVRQYQIKSSCKSFHSHLSLPLSSSYFTFSCFYLFFSMLYQFFNHHHHHHHQKNIENLFLYSSGVCLHSIQCMHVYIMFGKFIIHHVESAYTVRSTIACILRHYDVIYG